jgi:hypothetical protein
MPGFLPGRPGGERDEPLLDMLLERRPTPPGAPPEMHDLERMLAAVAGPAEPGELAGEAAALAAFAQLSAPAGISPAARARLGPLPGRRRPHRRLHRRPARGGLPLAAALAVAAASLVAAYSGVLPGPIQRAAHLAVGAPAGSPPPSPGGVTLRHGARRDVVRAPSPSAAPGRPARPHPGAGPPRPQFTPSGYAPGRLEPRCTARPEATAGPSQLSPSQPAPASGTGGWLPPSPAPAATCPGGTLPARDSVTGPVQSGGQVPGEPVSRWAA